MNCKKFLRIYWRLIAIVWVFSACNSGKPLVVSERLEPAGIMGSWYEVANINPSATCNCPIYRFESGEKTKLIYGCFNSSARENTQHTGVLEPLDDFRQFNFNYKNLDDIKYYVLDKDANQKYIMLGTRDRQQLIILSRTTNLAAATFKKFLNKAEELGFNTSQLNYQEHNCR